MRKEIHQSKCEEWEKLIDQWIGSGLSKNNGVTKTTSTSDNCVIGSVF